MKRILITALAIGAAAFLAAVGLTRRQPKPPPAADGTWVLAHDGKSS